MNRSIRLFKIIVLAAIIAFIPNCSGTGPGNDDYGKITNLKFNLSGARAIISTDAVNTVMNTAERNTFGSNDILFKILEDDSVMPIFDSSKTNWIPGINFIAHSPVAGEKDIYISFQGSWWYDNEKISSFIHIKADGTAVNIIPVDNSTWSSVNSNQNTDPVAFDGAGRIYFTVSESSGSSSTNVIYVYDPAVMELTPLTAAISDTYYQHVSLTDDGAYIVAYGQRGTYGGNIIRFLRLIPVVNPNNYENLFYTNNGTSSYINSFAINMQKKEVFISGYNIAETNTANPTLFRMNINGASKEWFPFMTNANLWSLKENISNNWHPYFMNGSNPDYDKIMNFFYSLYKSDLIEFRYNGKVNQEALASLNETDRLQVFGQGENYIFITGSETKASIPNLDAGSAQKLFFAGNNSLFGLLKYNGKSIICQLTDSNGKRDFYFPLSMATREVIDIKTTESHVYYTGSVGVGYQNVFRFNNNYPDTEENLFGYIHSRNINTMEVFDFTIGGDFLYFSGTQGISLVTGKINMITGLYTELSFGLKVNHIIAY